MHNIIVYYTSIKSELMKTGYQLGYSRICEIPYNIRKVSYWYKDFNVVAVSYIGDIILSVKNCNNNTIVTVENITYDEFQSRVKEVIKPSAVSSPSLLSILEGVAYESTAAYSTQASIVTESISNMSNGFLELFKSDLKLLFGTNKGQITTIEQFSLYRENATDDIYCLSEIQDSLVILRNLKNIANRYRTADFADFTKRYKKVTADKDLHCLLMWCLNTFHEIMNVSELTSILRDIGCKNLTDLNSMAQYTLFDIPETVIRVSTDALNNDIWFIDDGWVIRVCTEKTAGLSSVYYTQDYPKTFREVGSLHELLNPQEILNFVTTFIISLLQSADFILKDMIGIRDYMVNLLSELYRVKAVEIPSNVTWDKLSNLPEESIVS